MTALSPNATTPILIVLGCPLHEGAGGNLRRIDPRRLEVLGAHAVRDVEGEDHRALALAARRRSRSVGRARTRPARSPPRRARTGCGAAAARRAARRRHEPFGRRAARRAGRAGGAPTSRRARAAARARGTSSIHGEPSDISAAAAVCATRRCERAPGRGRPRSRPRRCRRRRGGSLPAAPPRDARPPRAGGAGTRRRSSRP